MHRSAQREVYEYMAPKLYHTCKRYLKVEVEIEEALADAFYAIFTKLDQLKEYAAFEAWARKIAVNQCLATLRKKINFNLYLEDLRQEPEHHSTDYSGLEERDLLQLLDYLPEGCRTIFNLFAVEGYSHKEIASKLNISEGTSKSQLNFSKAKLQVLVNQLYYSKAK
jgi:RNA polymerase sigma factor (sigma-70 family)